MNSKSSWKKSSKFVSCIGGAIEQDAIMALRVDNPELHKQICNTYENVVDDGELHENEQGELAIVYGGAYYPLQSGKWIVQEAFEAEDEMEYEDVEYNYCIEIQGYHFLLIIE